MKETCPENAGNFFLKMMENYPENAGKLSRK